MIVTGQSAACWTVVTKNGRYGYVTNAGTGNLSGFELSPDGEARVAHRLPPAGAGHCEEALP